MVLEGDAGQRGMLRLAGIHRADAVVMACGSGRHQSGNRHSRSRCPGHDQGTAGQDPARTAQRMALRSGADAKRRLTQACRSAHQSQRQRRASSAAATFFLRAARANHIFCSPASARWRRKSCSGRRAAISPCRASAYPPPCWIRAAANIPASAQATCSEIGEIADLNFVPCAFTDQDFSWQENVIAGIKARPPHAVVVAVRPDDIALETATRFRKMLDSLGLTRRRSLCASASSASWGISCPAWKPNRCSRTG